MKRLRRLLIFLLIAIPIIVWLVLGPGMRSFLGSRSRLILDQLKQRSEGHILAESVSGDFWSGVALKHVVIYADNDPSHLPILDADTVTLFFSLANLLSNDLTPSRIHVAGFNAVLHVSEDGSVSLPKWKFKMAEAAPPTIMHAGFVESSRGNRVIEISCERGVLEIVKRFPKLTEPVNLSITQLGGQGKYLFERGFTVDSLEGRYFSTPVTVRGRIPSDSKESMDLGAQVGNIELSTLFNDLDPLFRGSTYLPSGTSKGEIHLTGSKDLPEVGGTFDLEHGTIGNVSIDNAHAAVSYSAGVVDLTGVTGETYGGTVAGKGQINLLSAAPLWQMSCKFDSVNLGQYLTSNGYYAYELGGAFSGTVDANGDFKNRDKLAGRVEAEAKGGTYLSPFSQRFMLASQNSQPTTPVQQSDMVNFDNANISLDIHNSRITVGQFHFVSHELQVDAHGDLGFDKSISATGNLSVPVDKAKQNRKLSRFVSLLPDSMDRVSLDFSLSGFLNDIHFDAQPSANLLRGLLDQGSDLMHGLGDTLHGSKSPGN